LRSCPPPPPSRSAPSASTSALCPSVRCGARHR
jgi:hypothetical protein